jgi:hypothetical protein
MNGFLLRGLGLVGHPRRRLPFQEIRGSRDERLLHRTASHSSRRRSRVAVGFHLFASVYQGTNKGTVQIMGLSSILSHLVMPHRLFS